MCLSDVYISGEPEKIATKIAHVAIEGDKVLLTDLMGRRTSVTGTLADVDLLENKITIEK